MKTTLLILLFWLLYAPFSGPIDLAVTEYFYHNNQFSQFPLFLFLYDYGLLPSQLTGVACVGILLWSLFGNERQQWRRAAAMTLLTLLIGCVVIVNWTFKDHWGRPRPKQVEQFGGSQPFRPFYKPNFFHQPEPSRAFPCGHCAGGFFFFAVAFAGQRLHLKWMEISGYVLILLLGGGLSLTRIAMGGHFLSDVLASATILWLTACFFEWNFFDRTRRCKV